MKKRLVPSVAAGFAAALYFCIVLPMQTYLGCVDSPPYSLGDLLGEFCVYFCLSWFGVSVVLFALSYVPLAKATVDAKGRRHKKISLQFHVLVLAVVVAAIVESGPLAIGLPELNGNFDGYRSGFRSCLDLSVLATIVVLPLLCYRWLKRHVAWIAAAIAFYSAILLLDVNKAKSSLEVDGDMMLHDFIPRYDVVEGSAFSPSNNVIVLILDTFSSHAMAEIFRTDPDLAERFPGFVNYVNNLGMHWTTSVAVPGIMTGRFYENSADLSAYGISPFTEASFVKEYVDNNLPVYLNIGPYPLGWSNRVAGTGGSGRMDGKPSQITIESTLEFRIGDLSLFRIVPYGLKERFAMSSATRRGEVMHKVNGATPRGNINHDDILWPMLASRPINASLLSTLHVHHSSGGHSPITCDEKGNRVNLQKVRFRDYVSFCKFALKELASCFDLWRENGVYDASTIMVISDHGVYDTWPETKPYLHGIPSFAFPALMVKPRGSKVPYCESDMPTSHVKIAPLVCSLRTKALSRNEIDAILYTEKRFCRDCNNGNIIDWTDTGNWAVEKTERPDVEKDRDSLLALHADKTYSLVINAPPEDYPDFLVSNGNRSHTCGLRMEDLQKPMRVSFRLPSSGRDYDMLLRVRFHNNPSGNVVRVIGRCGSSVDNFSSEKSRDNENYLLLKGCKSGEDGLVHIDMYYAGGKRASVFMDQMRISRYISANLAENDFFLGNVAKSVDMLRSWRIDTSFVNTGSGVASLSGSGKQVAIECPTWLLNNGHQGVVAHGQAFSCKYKLICRGGGDVLFSLRGIDRRCDGKRLKVFADYESFKINGREMLEGPIQTWYDNAYKIPWHLEDGEELQISVVAKPHKYDYLMLRRLLLGAAWYIHQVERSVDGCLALPEMQQFLDEGEKHAK